jgi:hypothetical protein
MRQALTALLVVLLFVPHLPAKTNHDWDNVKKLHPGTAVEIFLWRAERLDGEIEGVGDAGLQLDSTDFGGARVGALRNLDRTEIRKIVRLHHSNRPPNSHQWLLIGPVAGGAIGATAGAITDARSGHANAHGLTDGFGGVMLGFVAVLVTLTVVDTVVMVRDLHGHATRVVYEDTGNH